MTSRSRTKMLGLALTLSMIGLTATVSEKLTAQTAANDPKYADNIGATNSGLISKTDSTAFGGTYLECQIANPFSSAVEFTLAGLNTSTSYDVYATWKRGDALPTNVQFQGAPISLNATVDQTKAPVGYTAADGRTWQKIGTIPAGNSTVYVIGRCQQQLGGRFDAVMAVKPPTVAACGDGFTQGTEECDDRNQNDSDTCTNACKRRYCGDGIVNNGERCDQGAQNGVLPQGPNYWGGCTTTCMNTDTSVCGNGVVDHSYNPNGEQCDDGNTIETDGCTNWCRLPTACGNGIVESGEQCDDNNRNDNDACTNACNNAKCLDGIVWTNVEGCDDGNPFNNDACSTVCTLTPVCGNGLQDYGEQCDDSNTVATDACTGTCQTARCGDGIVRTGVEQCDDGNSNNNDSCRNNCTTLTVACGNGVIQAGEQCDDFNTVATDGCTATCQTARCGDGVVRTGVEACDDGNQVNNDACTNTCANARCGDGFVQGSEACDDGNTNNNDACRNNCTVLSLTCGNGVIQTGEQCDDFNTVATDACTATCQTARCGDGVIRTGVETCDDGNSVGTDGCTASCQLARCGDRIVQIGVELCDDGNGITTDTCTNACQPSRCGDGIVRPGYEQCDDGNSINEDACTNACVTVATTNPCGNGIVQGMEQCDDGNRVNTDSCTNACTDARCGDGIVRPGVELCDDANGTDGDACTNACRAAACGDGILRVGTEQCDDGNANNADTCTNACVPPAGGSLGTNPGTTPAGAALTIRNVDLGQSSPGLVTSSSLPAVSFTAAAGNQNVSISNLQFIAQQGNIQQGFWVVLKETRPGDVANAFYEGRYWYGTLQNGKFVVSGPVSIPANTTKNFNLEIYTQQDFVNGQNVAAFNPQIGPVQLNFDSATANYVRASTTTNGVTTQLANIATNGVCGAASCAIAVQTGPTIVHNYRHAGNLTITGELGATSTTIAAGTESPVLLRLKLRMTADEDATLHILPFRVQGAEAVQELSLKIDGLAVAPAILMPCSYLAPYSIQERDLAGQGGSTGYNWFQLWSAGQANNPSNEFCAVFNYPTPILKRGTESIVEVRTKIKPYSTLWTSGTKVRVSLIQDEHYLYAIGETSMTPLRPKNTVTEGGNITYTGTLSSNEHTAQ